MNFKKEVIVLNWRDINVTQPEPDQACLTQMKHGVISGWYGEKDSFSFKGYYWHDLEWSAVKWVPIEEVVS